MSLLAVTGRPAGAPGGLAAGVTALTLVLAAAQIGCHVPPPAGSGPRVELADKHRGVSFEHAWGRRAAGEGYGSAASDVSLARLEELGVDWIAVTPFGFQTGVAAPTFRWGGRRRDETDARLRGVTAQAHARGIRVLLKPHLWLRPPAWVGAIEPQRESDWEEWFATYRAFILHYARLAAEAGIEALCVGNELSRTTHREREWRDLIAEVRAIFPGLLTYGAHADEVWDVPFWDALDLIGVSAYFTIARREAPTEQALSSGWRTTTRRLARLAARWDRPILFTEIGYRSVDFAGRHPWKFDGTTAPNLELQARLYRTFFTAVWPEPWLAGAYWWKWRSTLDDGGPDDDDYTPRGKPAEDVLERYYAEAAGARPSGPGS